MTLRRAVGSAAFAALLAGCSDADGDGSVTGVDCDDTRPEDFPGADEVCDGRDNDCDGLVDEDVAIEAWLDRDGDGWGDDDAVRRVCTLPEGAATRGGDCDDLDAEAFPGAPEVCDGRDDDCDGEVDEGTTGTFYVDADGDGHGDPGAPLEGCFVGPGASRSASDCDDAEPLAWSGAVEVCDGVDNDCDGDVDEDLPWVAQWEDADGDGAGGPVVALGCDGAPGLAPAQDDCDDADAGVGPSAGEVADNGDDDDCDGWVDEAVVDVGGDLEAALDAAGPGDVVQLRGGPWKGPLDLRGFRGTLAGEGCGRTVVTGDHAGPVVTMDGGALRGMTLTAGSQGGLAVRGDVAASGLCIVDNSNLGIPGRTETRYGGGVEVWSGTLTLEDSLVARNLAFDGGGINVERNGVLLGARLRVLDNETQFDGAGLAVRSGRAEVRASVFAGNRASDDGGAVASRDGATGEPGHVLLDRCTLVDNASLYDVRNPGANGGFGSAVYVRADSTAEVRASLVVLHHVGVEQPLSSEDPGALVVDGLGYAGNSAHDLAGGWDVTGRRGRVRFLDYDPDGDPTTWDLRQHPVSDFTDLGAWTGPDALPDHVLVDVVDRDEDGLPDAWEAVVGLQTGRDDADADADGDGLDAAAEWVEGTHPLLDDSDGDGVVDGQELDLGRDPLRPERTGPVPVPAGPHLAVVGEPVHVRSLSFDPEGTWPVHAWQVVVAPGAAPTLTDDGAGGVRFTPGSPGLYSLQLSVTSGGLTRAASHTVAAVPAIVVPDDYATLTEALGEALSGDVIAVRPGVWPVHVVSAGRDLTILGLGERDEVVLVPNDTRRVVSWTSPRALALAHLTVADGADTSGGAVLCTGCLAGSVDPACSGGLTTHATLELRDVVLRDSTATGQGGGLRAERCDVVGRGLAVLDNTAGSEGGGIVAAVSALDLVDVEVSGNRAGTSGGGLYGSSEQDLVFVRNGVLAGNEAPDGAAIAWFALNDPNWVAAFDQLTVTDHATAGSVIRGQRGNLRVLGLLSQRNTATSLFRGPLGQTPGRVDVLALGLGSPEGTPFGPNVVEAADLRRIHPTPLSRAGEDAVRASCWRPADAAWDAGWVETSDPDGTPSALGACGGPDAPPELGLAQVDTDGDGMPDLWELLHGLDRLVSGHGDDTDGDGRDDVDEYLADLDPQVAD